MKFSLFLLVLGCVVYLATAASYLRGEPIEDLQTAASGHGHYGRVQIKVYRGQSKGGHGHDYGHAPYGYWVRQPPDGHGHH